MNTGPQRLAAALLGLLISCSVSAAEPSSDQQVTRSLQQALERDARLHNAEIQVSTFQGAVTLKGTVASLLEVHQAEQVARRTVGVRSVLNLLRVERTPRPDEEIAEEVRRRLTRSRSAVAESIHVAVSDGVVTLSGESPSWAHVREAERMAGEVRGVRRVRNQVTLAAPAASAGRDKRVKADVEAELGRDAYLAGLPIEVHVEAGVVQLEGEVPNLFHKERAGEEARLIANTRAVDNRLVVASQRVFEMLPQAPTDEELQEAVADELRADPRVAATEISVAAAGGQVTLTGSVASMNERQVAERIARSLAGVRRVENRLEVDAVTRPDAEIQEEIRFSLNSDALLFGQAVVVTVNGGSVALSGEVRDFNSKIHAARLAARVRGVRQLTNELKVSWNPATNDDAVRSRIQERLRSNGITRPIAVDVEVTVREGHVTLAGRVARTAERIEAERIARLTDGVRTVRNALAAPD
jgi:osmotically-inducible protein OsmY